MCFSYYAKRGGYVGVKMRFLLSGAHHEVGDTAKYGVVVAKNAALRGSVAYAGNAGTCAWGIQRKPYGAQDT